MKTLYIILIIGICLNGYSQTTRSVHNRINKTKTSKNTNRAKAAYKSIPSSANILQPRETVTEQRLKGAAGGSANSDTAAAKKTVTKSPFVGGIHAAPNAGEKFDTVSRNINNINSINSINNVSNSNVTANPIAAPNDTIFNDNTITDDGVLTNSGAVDKSGNAQFGQSNWGNSRSTIGESQWTVPPPVTASFTKEFPTAANASWSRNNKDTSVYLARYKSGDVWVTSNYNTTGQRLDMRTEVPLVLLPQPVKDYVSKLPANLQVTTITRWQVLGKADVYEIQTRAGKTMSVNNDGVEVGY